MNIVFFSFGCVRSFGLGRSRKRFRIEDLKNKSCSVSEAFIVVSAGVAVAVIVVVGGGGQTKRGKCEIFRCIKLHSIRCFEFLNLDFSSLSVFSFNHENEVN